jgi:hypothetical protein
MTRFLSVSGQMGGSAMQGTVIVSLTITRMLRAGFVPWMYLLTLDHASKCMTWQISCEYMPEIASDPESLTSYLTAEYALEYSAGSGESIVGLIRTDSTFT